MRDKFFPMILLSLICAFSVDAQIVDERRSSAQIVNGDIDIVLAVDAASTISTDAELKIISPNGEVVSQFNGRQDISRGKQFLKFKMSIDQDELENNEDIAWFRLNYRIGNSGGIISLSRMINELFELRVSASSETFAGNIYRARVRAFQPYTQAPAAGVAIDGKLEIELESGETDELVLTSKAVTGSDGIAVIEFKIPASAQVDSDADLTIIGRKNGLMREVTDDINTLSTKRDFLLMTDKTLYQPDQTLNVRGIFLEGNDSKTIAAGRDIEIRIEDESDTVLYRERLKTSDFGVAFISWQIPANAKLGRYYINVRDEFGEQIGYQNVKISRYDLPNFAVKTKADKTFYLPDDSFAEIDVSADYLFGKPVTKGSVRVVEEKQRTWNWKDQKYDINEGEKFEGETDADGKFKARFPLASVTEKLKRDTWSKYIDVNFAAYFTDPTTNKTEQKRFDIRVSREPIHLYFIGARGNVHPKLPYTGYVTAFYADGAPAKCNIEIKGVTDTDSDKKKTAKIITAAVTNSDGVAKFKFTTPKWHDIDEDLELEIIAKDKDGKTGTIEREIDYDDIEDAAILIEPALSIIKPGQPIDLLIISTLEKTKVQVDVLTGWTAISSHSLETRDGRGRLSIPYSPQFAGEITLAAYIEPDTDQDHDIVKDVKQVIYPAKRTLDLNVKFDKDTYKPGEDAKLSFGVTGPSGNATESAIGLAIVDTAVEHRARTDSEFGSAMSGFYGWLGYGSAIGGINIKDIRDLDVTKPITADMQLAAEALLANAHYSPAVYFSDNYLSDAKYVFSSYFKPQAQLLSDALKKNFNESNYEYATDHASLVIILRKQNIEYDLLRDPWGERYRSEFGYEKENAVVRLFSNGADKTPNTRDDFEIFTESFKYFTPQGINIEQKLVAHYQHTDQTARDRDSVFKIIGVSELKDIHGRDYEFDLDGEGRYQTIRIRSLGKNGKVEVYKDQYYSNYFYSWGDDYQVWNARIDIFGNVEKKIDESQRGVKNIPTTEAEFKSSLIAADINFDELRDAKGNPLYINVVKHARFADRITTEMVKPYGAETFVERKVITPVTQNVITFTIRSPGRDGKVGTWDDSTMTSYTHVLAEQTKDDEQPVIKNISFSKAYAGEISGVVGDATGAVIPGASITATNNESKATHSVTTNSSGRYLVVGLAAGNYDLRVEAAGFKTTVISTVPVRDGQTTNQDLILEVGEVSEAVTVTGTTESLMNTTNASVGTTVESRQIASLPLNGARNAMSLLQLQPGATAAVDEPTSTPRLREYFPETLLWRPDIVTDSAGKAQVDLKMADNITTWKAYAIASTRDGKVGIAEKEITAFQAFFADLDTPKFLTDGDEIHLPVQVRNYTEKAQKVDVKMDSADWFSFLGEGSRQIDVPTGDSANAVFGFKAMLPVKDGKQRVTALAQGESDAIEKSVTVRPDGHEVVDTSTEYFTRAAKFHNVIPENAIAGTPRSVIKIYPNLFANVTESVEGLLRRPYGCGEQTISSTYPNLMIVKFVDKDTPLKRRALRNLMRGYERLLGYQAANGGFTYWGPSTETDLALTAYAVRFLRDASGYINVDRSVIAKAQQWLLTKQRPDGSFYHAYYNEKKEDAQRAKMLTTYVARTLTMPVKENDDDDSDGLAQDAIDAAVERAIEYLHKRSYEIDEPYSLALLGLAAIESDDTDQAEAVVERLIAMAKDEGNSSYWNLETNTPFNGWGSAGRIETTALVTQLLVKVKNKSTGQVAIEKLLSRAVQFLLKNKDRYGVWYSTQTTVNVLDSILAVMNDSSFDKGSASRIKITVNGREKESITIDPDRLEPIEIDVSNMTAIGSNNIEITGSNGQPLMANVQNSHYIKWEDAFTKDRNVNSSRAIALNVACDKTDVAIMDSVTCKVKAERIGFQGYGMLLAEIGTPPGADIDREALNEMMKNNRGVSRYDVLPDRVVFYMWAYAGGTSFDLKFKPRYGIYAQTPASIVYDYYNPEAQAIVRPTRFAVK